MTRIYCTNNAKEKNNGYDFTININDSKDVGFNFWLDRLKLKEKFSEIAIDLLYIYRFLYMLLIAGFLEQNKKMAGQEHLI